MTVGEMLVRLDEFAGKNVVQVNWTDGGFGLLLVEELV